LAKIEIHGPGRRRFKLATNLQWERNLEIMFEAALREIFDRWKRKYDPQSVFAVWAEIFGSEGFRPHFQKVGWKIDLTIQEALEDLDDYCQEIENKIRFTSRSWPSG